MLRCLNELIARAFARERGWYFGQARDGAWYAGPREKLIKLGVAKPRKETDK
jgi:hypothetical protein